VARIFQAIRDAVGDELEIGLGTHGQFSTAGAKRIAVLRLWLRFLLANQLLDAFFWPDPI
jgi:L-alanine-DL-glutamate epimerase-like enolase superfamily enzyme